VKWKHLPIVAFDTETTGLEPLGGDRIIEFAAVEFRLGPDGRIVDEIRHSWLVNPGMPIPRKVQRITGIGDADVASQPPFEAIADDVCRLLGGAITVAHNFPFDLAFVTQELARIGRVWPDPLAEVDTVDLSLRVFADDKGHKLEDLARRLEIPLEGAHRAVNDALACGRAFCALVRQKGIDDELQAMLDWAGAIGQPPEDGPLVAAGGGRVVFRDGEHEGQAVGDHPIHLAWMEKARERVDGAWRWRYPDSTRRWIRRWLDVRGSGRSRQGAKSVRAEDWGLDSCIADRPVAHGFETRPSA